MSRGGCGAKALVRARPRMIEVHFGVRAEMPALISNLDRLVQWVDGYDGWVASQPAIVDAFERLAGAMIRARIRQRWNA